MAGGVGSPVDRKISFAVLTERSDSFHSSTTSLSAMDPSTVLAEDKKDPRGKSDLFTAGTGEKNQEIWQAV